MTSQFTSEPPNWQISYVDDAFRTQVKQSRLVKVIETTIIGEDPKTGIKHEIREFYAPDGLFIGKLIRPLKIEDAENSAVH